MLKSMTGNRRWTDKEGVCAMIYIRKNGQPYGQSSIITKDARAQWRQTTCTIPGRSSGIQPVADRQAMPLTTAQQRLLLRDQLLPDSDTYIVPLSLHCKGSLRMKIFRRCLCDRTHRYHTVRTIAVVFRNHRPQPSSHQGRLLRAREQAKTGERD